MTKVFFTFKFNYSNSSDKLKNLPFLSELEPVVLLSSFSTFNFFKSKTDFYYNLNVTTNNQVFSTILLQNTILNRLPYLVDAYAISHKTDSVFYVFNCFYSNRFTNFFFNITNNQYTSITSFCKSAVWVERELKEFSDLYIKGLLDSRKLLKDYTILKNKNSLIYYDLITQEVF